jgi:hypothetical protein
MEGIWEIGIATAGALVSIGAALARRDPPRETLAPSPTPATLQVTAAELEAVRGEVARLEERITGLEDRERAGAEHAAEFRGQVRESLGRIFDKLNIQRAGERGSVP